ncbi:hypothetical protein [Flavobacterium crassostreae]|uniref:Uncharacterized protein n=1 Tax=Flavobacterium crassostreae TaxID=1763534 RepID=A0A1B9E7W0_9FLAO|nr:hypothetical protein [Flavobacterium crassostreae]OCB78023.1 hypothetical protein LPBF_03480 [Flavobacterium crassostreae]
MQEKDAKHLYQWAEQWELSDPETVKLKGTPVLVFGNYDFEAPKPWLKLVQDPKALHISEQELEKITQPFKETILKEQQKRVSFYAAKQQH